MRGHEALIAMRRGGLRPDLVAIHAGTDHSACWRDWRDLTPTQAQVEIQDGDSLAGIDLRFTVGLFVIVSGEDADRVAAVHAACLDGGARRVLSAAVTFDASRPNAPGALGEVLDSGKEAAQ